MSYNVARWTIFRPCNSKVSLKNYFSRPRRHWRPRELGLLTYYRTNAVVIMGLLVISKIREAV
jgi:hypothetical protein